MLTSTGTLAHFVVAAASLTEIGNWTLSQIFSNSVIWTEIQSLLKIHALAQLQ